MTRSRRPFIRKAVCALLLLPLACPPHAFAGDGGTAAALRAIPMTPSGEAVWSQAAADLANDPAIPFLDENETEQRLQKWREDEALSTMAVREAAKAWSVRAQVFLGRAWDLYYAFDFDGAAAAAREAAALAPRLEDSRAAADLLFESALLEGMAAKAGGRGGGGEAFARAAALRPEAELPEVRYSPTVREDFERARALLLAGERGRLTVHGAPPGAQVLLDGAAIGNLPVSEVPVLPGEHFVEVRAPGRRPVLQGVSPKTRGVSLVEAELPLAGPEGDPGSFFTTRLREGDRDALAALAARLGVDFVILGREDAGRLEAWLVERSGRTVATVLLAGDGGVEDPSAARRMLLAQTGGEPVADPGIPLGYSAIPSPTVGPDSESATPPRRRWAWLAAGLAALLIALSSADKSETTRVEASW